MKAAVLAFFLLGLWSKVSSQMNTFALSLEYSPNFSSITNPYSSLLSQQDGSFRVANNIFLKGGYKLTRNLYATGAIGMMGTREYVTVDFHGQSEIEKLESNRFHSYVVTPVGFTYYMGSFFISPEIGIGWNVSSRGENHWYYTDGTTIEDEYVDENDLHRINNTSYPLFLSFGNEIRMKSYALVLGAKAYYDLNSLSDLAHQNGHSYGFGLLAGVRF